MTGQSDVTPPPDTAWPAHGIRRNPSHHDSTSEPRHLSRSEPGSHEWSPRGSLVAVFRNTAGRPADVDALRDVVRAYVDYHRRLGARVERIIVDLEDAMRAAGAARDYADPAERAFAEAVIGWGVERYYGASDGAGPVLRAPPYR